jgi:hypothetical protein
MAVAAAYPFIEVRIDTSGLVPVAERAPGVIAVVGKSPNGANGGQAPVNVPLRVDSIAQAAELFAKINAGVVAETPLYRSLRLAMLQDPRPSKIYGVRVNGDDYAAALASLEAADDVTFVALAEEVATTAANLTALKNHVETMSAQGQKRLGVAMIDPARQKSPTYVADAVAAVNGLKSDSSRMVLLAARGAVGDVAVAGMAAMAAYDPHISIVLKKIRGVSMPTASQYSPSEITGLSEEGINPIIDPELIVGESLHFAEGRTFTTDASLLYVDIVRTLDDIDFRLKAGLIGSVGDARITRSGMNLVRLRTEGILGPLLRRAVIAGFAVDMPVLNILSLPETAWTETDRTIVATARANRTVDMFVSITYGPAVHRLKVTLAPKF